MTTKAVHAVITGDAPNTATSGIIDAALAGFGSWNHVSVTAEFAGNTGGTIDVYVQRFDTVLDAFVDWIHFPQQADAAAEATYYAPGTISVADIFTIGQGATPALAVDSYTGGHPGDQVRVWAVSGTDTTNGATVTVSFTGTKF